MNTKTLNIYIASSFKYKQECEDLKEKLLEIGHNIPDIWWNIDSKQKETSDAAWYSKPKTKAISARHFKTIKECDILILVCPSYATGQFNGANVEVGYALALNKPVYSIGLIAQSAMYSDVIKCYDLEILIQCLDIQALSER